MSSAEIHWCGHCGTWFVRCPRCGMNSCSVVYGEEGTCPKCPEVQEVTAKIYSLLDSINYHALDELK